MGGMPIEADVIITHGPPEGVLDGVGPEKKPTGKYSSTTQLSSAKFFAEYFRSENLKKMQRKFMENRTLFFTQKFPWKIFGLLSQS